MESYLSFLRPITPEKSLDEILDQFRQLNSEQTGDGVVTRRQAKEAAIQAALGQNAQVPPNEVTPDEVNNVDEHDQIGNHVSLPTSPQPGVEPAIMVSSGNEANHSNQTPGLEAGSPSSDSPTPGAAEVAESELYSNDTLVAENSDLKAFAIQSHFRRMRNFMYIILNFKYLMSTMRHAIMCQVSRPVSKNTV